MASRGRRSNTRSGIKRSAFKGGKVRPERRFTCLQCGKKFRYPDSLRDHTTMAHGPVKPTNTPKPRIVHKDARSTLDVAREMAAKRGGISSTTLIARSRRQSTRKEGAVATATAASKWNGKGSRPPKSTGKTRDEVGGGGKGKTVARGSVGSRNTGETGAASPGKVRKTLTMPHGVEEELVEALGGRGTLEAKDWDKVVDIVKRYPEASYFMGCMGRLPIHIASAAGVPLTTVFLLLQANKTVAKLPDRTLGQVALHFATERGASLKIIGLLYQAFPEAVTVKSMMGRLPLHLALLNGATPEVVTFLLKAAPDTIREVDNLGQLPLHCIMRGNPCTDTLKLMVDAYPESVKVKDKQAMVPFWVAVKERVASPVVKYILNQYPKVMNERMFKKRGTALHGALEFQHPFETIQCILDWWKLAAAELDSYLNFPLHIALTRCASLDSVRMVLDAWPAAVEKINKFGELPLHLAAKRASDVEVVKLILAAYPQGARCATRCLPGVNSTVRTYGNLPLHLAVAGIALTGKEESYLDEPSNVENLTAILSLLLAEYPEAASIRNDDGMYALSIAADNQMPATLLEPIIERYPRAACMKDLNGWLPLQSYVQWAKDVIELYLRWGLLCDEAVPVSMLVGGNFVAALRDHMMVDDFDDIVEKCRALVMDGNAFVALCCCGRSQQRALDDRLLLALLYGENVGCGGNGDVLPAEDSGRALPGALLHGVLDVKRIRLHVRSFLWPSVTECLTSAQSVIANLW